MAAPLVIAGLSIVPTVAAVGGGVYAINALKKFSRDPLVRIAGYAAIAYFAVQAYSMLRR